jgi:hypothetical protein
MARKREAAVTLEMLNFLGGVLSCAGPLIALAHWMLMRLADKELILAESGMRLKPPYVGMLHRVRDRRRASSKEDRR